MARLRAVLSIVAARWTAVITTVAYLVLYLLSIGDLTFSALVPEAPAADAVGDWRARLLERGRSGHVCRVLTRLV
jgi:hypothetical protein